MASIQREALINASTAQVWDAVRDVGALHDRLVPGFVVDTVVDGEVRTVCFGNGLRVRERIVDVDDARRRIAWSVLDAPQLRYHHASLQLFDDAGRCRAVWIADLLPDELASRIATMIEQGLMAMQRAHERTATADR
ncbi:SRPBCC family protein [Solimonas terrae]|uniref:SRPBCC family protein n=1 Tax=Solimonas terrae TaxID=1396819 RepID=A0A6M2BPP5_9GAMM|nr:SRPBCC family protein [Solimonas terrae]NGY04201.1 SRPBCC family protein [Solimonas terrae]